MEIETYSHDVDTFPIVSTRSKSRQISRSRCLQCITCGILKDKNYHQSPIGAQAIDLLVRGIE